MEHATNTSTPHIEVDFMSIEVPTNVMSFLIFLPLTSGLVSYILNFLKFVYKMI